MNQYHPGQVVRISNRIEQRHHRVPAYIKGKTGVVDSVCSHAPRPEEIANWVKEPDMVPVYRIQVPFKEFIDGYQYAKDNLQIEVYEHWLSAI